VRNEVPRKIPNLKSKEGADPASTRSKVWICGRSIVGIAGSNLAGGMDVCHL